MSHFAADDSLNFHEMKNFINLKFNFTVKLQICHAPILSFHSTDFSQEKKKSQVPNWKALLQSSCLKDNHSVNLYPSRKEFRMWLKERESRFLLSECVSVYSREIRESEKHLHA